MNVASAGVRTSVSAVCRMLWDAAANGRATTNTTEPSIVAMKQPGRTSATSVMAAMELSSARQKFTLPKPTVMTHNRINNFVFIILRLDCGLKLRRAARLFKLFVIGGGIIYSFGVSHKSARIAAMIKSFQGQELDARYLGYFDCFNRQLFYEAHDVLEDLWLLDRHGPNGNFYKGLIQLAGAFVHLQKHRLRPSAALFKLARANFEKYPDRHEQLNLAAVQLVIAGWLVQLEKGGFLTNPLTPKNVPQLALQK